MGRSDINQDVQVVGDTSQLCGPQSLLLKVVRFLLSSSDGAADVAGVDGVSDGDEYVYLEQVEAPTSDLPEGARAVIFNEAPAPRGIEPSLAAIEGALELDDLSEATTLLYELPVERLEDPEVLALRIELSRRRGHDKKAAELREQLRLKSPQHPLAGGEGSEIPGR